MLLARARRRQPRWRRPKQKTIGKRAGSAAVREPSLLDHISKRTQRLVQRLPHIPRRRHGARRPRPIIHPSQFPAFIGLPARPTAPTRRDPHVNPDVDVAIGAIPPAPPSSVELAGRSRQCDRSERPDLDATSTTRIPQLRPRRRLATVAPHEVPGCRDLGHQQRTTPTPAQQRARPPAIAHPAPPLKAPKPDAAARQDSLFQVGRPPVALTPKFRTNGRRQFPHDHPWGGIPPTNPIS